MATSPKRIFIGWNEPILRNATQRLFAEHATGGLWDLRNWLVVLPSSLAKRRLQELLAIQAEEADCILYPPEIVTVGKLPEHLYTAKFPFAGEMVQILAWCRALQQSDTARLENVFPLPPKSGSTEQWLELGKMLSSVHRELASDQLNFEGVVQSLGSHPEAERWRALADVQRKYLEVLDSLELWDIQTARLVALQLKEPVTDRNILMLGTVDLNRTQRGFLAAVAEHVEVWVAAPPELADKFDEYGCLIGEAWEDATLAIPSDALLVGNSPADQFELAAACLAELGDEVHARDITLGVPDPSLVPLLEQHLNVAGADVRFGPGTPLAASEPGRLLQLVGNYLSRRAYVDFAALLRHPVVTRLVKNHLPTGSDSWLAEIDRYYAEVLPRTVERWTNPEAGGASVYRQVVELIDKWLEPLTVIERTIDQWAAPLLDLLRQAYAERTCNVDEECDERLLRACQSVTEHIVGLSDIPAVLTMSLSAAEVIDWLMHSMSGQLVPRPTEAGSIEILGWLDLTLDDAPYLILTGVHDGVVPECVNADPFLPNQLRRQLGMIDNARRYARDMYAFQVLLESRQQVRVVVGRTNLAGDPLVPSRLLLACDLAELPARVLRLSSDEALDVLPEVQKRWQAGGGEKLALTVPPPDGTRKPPYLTVTAFRTYLACPYRFYLNHVLKLDNVDDVDSELSAGQFGDLIHETLKRMHEDPISKSTDAAAIEVYLRETVERVAEEKYGQHPAAAIRVQIAQAQDRLASFAVKQAEHLAAGWETRYCEVKAELRVGDRFADRKLPIGLLGRIDRIDYHPGTGQWAVWDYKTSDGGTRPVQNHVNSKRGWTDLQLPLYRHLVRALGIHAEPTVGYILLPKSAREVSFVPADFSPGQLGEADAEALRIMKAVAEGIYEPRTLTTIPFDDYARICQVGTQQSSPPRPHRRVKDHRHTVNVLQLAKKRVVEAAERRLADPDDLALRGSVAQPLKPLMIRASAGTGKTYQLSNRLLQIILSGESVDHVLATTFTRKAAGEILQRVLVRLARACVDDGQFVELRKALNDLQFEQADCLAALRRVTRQLHRFRVSTLDSFYAQLARTFSLELRLSPGWSAVDPVREEAIRMQAIQHMLDQSDQRTLTSLVKMLAKGETKRSVAREIQETVEGGYHFYRSAGAQAFNELRVPKSPPEDKFREALEFLQRFDPGHKSIRKAQETIAELALIGDWESVVCQGLMTSAVQTGRYYKRELDPKLLDRLAIIRRKCAAELLPVRRAQSEAAYELLDSFNSQYMALLRRQRMLAFADITYLLSRWMNRTLSSEPTANDRSLIPIDQQQLKLRMDCGIDHLLLDEFQDTAPDQWHIIEPLAQPLTEVISPNSSFFCVGDTKQAIYGWRGGVAEIFDRVASSIANLSEAELSESYRSSPEVIDAVNDVFHQLTRHENFADCDEVAAQWCQKFPEHKTTRCDLPGYVLVKNGIACDPNLPGEDREVAELEHSAKMIAELASEASGLSIGVLFRDNRKVAVMIELLRQRGVSASQEGGNPLTDCAVVQLILSLCHLADHPGDTVAEFHVKNSPLISLFPEHVRDSASALAEWVWLQVTRLGLGRAISNFSDLLAPRLDWWDQHRLTQLITLAYQFEAQFTHRLRDFEAFVEQQKVALPSEAQVKVMTIHSSKGLEFDAVFLPDLGIPLAGHPPLMVARAPDPCAPPTGILRHMNEHVQALLPKEWREAFHARKAHGVREILCVLYVAMTRARSALYMVTAPRTSKTQNATQVCSSLLQSVLGEKELCNVPEAVLYERGNPEWYKARHRATAENVNDAGKPFPARAIALKVDEQTAPRRGFRVAAPSAMASMKSVQLSRIFTKNEMLGAAVGTLVHACFEQIEWLDDYTTSTVALRNAVLSRLTPEELRHISLDQEIEGFVKMLKLSAVRDALSRKRYADKRNGLAADEVQVENERRISLILDNQLISGSIDRLVLLKRKGRPLAAEIIDYKTDRWDERTELSEWIAQRVEHHGPQLRAYAGVVSRMLKLPLEHIECSLVLLSGNACVRCDTRAPEPTVPAPKYQQLHLAW